MLIDRERGVWHLTNGEAVTWADLARKACAVAGVDPRSLHRVESERSAPPYEVDIT